MSEISSLQVIDEESDSYSSEINIESEINSVSTPEKEKGYIKEIDIESEINSVSTPKEEKEEKLIISSEENKDDPENL